MMRQVWTLMRKEALIEWRSMHTLMGTLLYIASTVFAIYMMVNNPDPQVWNALFWIAQLFIIVSATSKSFIQEGDTRLRYYYTIAAPWQFILSKILYNLIYILLLAVLCLVLFVVLLGDVIVEASLFYGIALLGTASLSILFTFISAISGQAQQGAAMSAILGFPLAIPMILVVSKLSLAAVTEIVQEGNMHLVGIMGLLFVLMLVLALILYPFLWGE